MPARQVAGVPSDFRRFFKSVDPTADELIGACLWDRQIYVSGTTTLLTFFTAVRQSIRDGNLTIASQLPDREFVLVRSIRVVPIVKPDKHTSLAVATITTRSPAGAPVNLPTAADDLARLYNDGVLQFKILSKDYGQYPMFLLLPGTGIVTNTATITAAAETANNLNTSTVGNPDNRAVFSLAVPIPIPPQTGFKVTLEWATALTLSGLADGTTDMALDVVLDGSKIRPKQ
jgi:hypothetical protein